MSNSVMAVMASIEGEIEASSWGRPCLSVVVRTGKSQNESNICINLWIPTMLEPR